MLGFMNCVVEAVVAKGVKGLFEFVPGGPYLHDIGADAFRRHKEKKAVKKLEDDLKDMVAAKADAAIAVARQAVEESAPFLPPREKALLTQYLAGMPDAARQSMKRKDDPSGRSIALGFTFRHADDIARVLPQSPPRFAAGDTVPGLSSWLLVKRLGAGGFGEVWLTKHHSQPEQRAVKFCTDPAARHRLVTHEKDLIDRVMAAGRHPNIVPLLDCNLSGATPWLMYEYVSGGTLADVIPTWKKLSPPDRLKQVFNALRTLSSAVGHCHALSPPIVHRDMKPANVLVDPARRTLRVTDFGIGGVAAEFAIAEETRGASRIGDLPSMLSGSYSMLYASPQQRHGEKPDPRDDIHALGVMAYQMLTYDLSASPGSDLADELRDAGAGSGLIDLIGKCVAQKADRRPKDATAFATRLASLEPAVGARRQVVAEVEAEEADHIPWERAGGVRSQASSAPPLSLPPPVNIWHYHHNQKQTGPMTFEELKQAAAKGKIVRDIDHVWKEGTPAWVLASAVPGLFTDNRSTSLARNPGEEAHFPLPGGLKMTFCWIPPRNAPLGCPATVVKSGINQRLSQLWSVLTATLNSPAMESERAGDENESTYNCQGFWLGKYPVTQSEWQALTGNNPSHFRADGNGSETVRGLDTSRFPVENVSWHDCKCYLEKLNAVGGVEKVFGKAGRFALPHEDDWKYACSGGLGLGSQNPLYWGNPLDSTMANISRGHTLYSPQANGSGGHPSRVGSYATKVPHPWGLCDMIGNVREWCEDTYENTTDRVMCGSSWADHQCDRDHLAPGFQGGFIGLRICLPLA